MRQLVFLGVALTVTTGCGCSSDSGQGQQGQGGSGTPGSGAASSAGGQASQGGVSGTAGRGGAGTTGTGGSTGGTSSDLKWFSTCGPPVCRAPVPGSGGASSGIPACKTTETKGASCAPAGAECDTGTPCSGPLKCTTSDPTHGGQCPISRAKYKTDIRYLTPVERAKLADDVQSIPLVRYRYKDGPERQHLGFIIEDVEPSPSVDSPHDQVDLYGYTSMAVAAIQEQRHEIDAMKAELEELRRELRLRPPAPAHGK